MATLGDSLASMNKDARAMIHLAFDDLGGVDRLVKWANDPEHPGNLSAFYTQIWSKIIPREVKAEHSGKDGGPIIISWQGPQGLTQLEAGNVEDAVIATDMTMEDEDNEGAGEEE